jgi:hypothetical protein
LSKYIVPPLYNNCISSVSFQPSSICNGCIFACLKSTTSNIIYIAAGSSLYNSIIVSCYGGTNDYVLNNGTINNLIFANNNGAYGANINQNNTGTIYNSVGYNNNDNEIGLFRTGGNGAAIIKYCIA